MGERLGQHFLKNKHFLRRIAGALELEPGDTVVEIGPGHGELTKVIIAQLKDCKIAGLQDCRAAKFFAIEKDKILYEGLISKFQDCEIVKFIHGDVLKVLPEIISNQQFAICNYKIVGNIPFYLTGRLLRILGELEQKPTRAVFTVQREVGERIVAQPPRMNLLAASVQFWAEPEVIDYIPKTAFRPQPRVDSVIIKLITKNGERIDNPNYQIQITNYYRLIKILFKQPRKTILNNLIKADLDAYIQIYDRRFVYKLDNQLNQPVKDASYNEMGQKKRWLMRNLEKIDINPADRPQDLSVGAIIKLSEMWYTQNRR